jgi:hypothetical protein
MKAQVVCADETRAQTRVSNFIQTRASEGLSVSSSRRFTVRQRHHFGGRYAETRHPFSCRRHIACTGAAHEQYFGRDLPKIASNDPMKTTPEENKALMEGSIAYYGTYTVNESERS